LNTAAWALLLAMMSWSPRAFAAAPVHGLGPPPGWVSVADDPQASVAAGAREATQATDYLLVDRQVRLEEHSETYVRYVTRINNRSAVEENSHISIGVDPASEKLVLHSLRVRRGGESREQLSSARITPMRRENGLESGLVDGQITLGVLLEDVRVGDIVDYSYTISRRDPLGDRRYADSFQTRWTSPVQYSRLRLLQPVGRGIQVLDRSGGPTPLRRESGGWNETTWEARDLAALRNETQRPGWHEFYPRVEFSEFADWNELREWALPLYQTSVEGPRGRPDPALAALVDDLKREPDPATRILKALAVVQEEVRYTGIEIGAGAYRPSPPAVVLARRYGDCKDKTLLLVTLLRASGIDAAPALVDTVRRRGVRERLPAPGAFDHVIARVRSGERTWWLDATRSAQARRLDTLGQASFGAALVLAPGEDGLDAIPETVPDRPQVEVFERYDLSQGLAAQAGLEVETRYRGSDAEAMRARMRGTTVGELTDHYLDYYHRRFPGIRSVNPIAVEDDESANEFVVREHYTIETPFAQAEGKDLRTFDLAAYALEDYVGKPENPRRSSPLALPYPLNVQHRISVALPDEWAIQPETTTVNGPGFSYRGTVAYSPRLILLDYRFETRDDHVLREDVDDYLARITEVGDDLYYQLTSGPEVVPGSAGPSVPVILTLLLALAASAWATRWTWRLPPGSRPEPQAGAPVGLKGWMILPAIGTLIAPLVLLASLGEFRVFLDGATFANVGILATGAGALATQAMVLAVIAWVVLLLGPSIALIGLLHRRAASFPRAFVLFSWAAVLLTLLSAAVVFLSAPVAGVTMGGMIADLVRALLSAWIWTAYMNKSQRVRATFQFEPTPVAAGKGNVDLAALPAAAS
jgi:transglutaminase-like putative cysteine protease